MWTKRYLLTPTKEEYFKTTHPSGTLCSISPLLVYYFYCTVNGMNSPWLIAGVFGCVILGIGLAYCFAILLKVYDRRLLPALCLLLGSILTAVSLIFAR